MLGSTSATNGDSTISQTFTAPVGATSLSFWYEMTCPDSVAYDWATASLTDNTSSGTVTSCRISARPTRGKQVTASLVPLHNYTLTLASHDDNYPGDPTYTLFDDVVLSAQPPEYDVYYSSTLVSPVHATGDYLPTCILSPMSGVCPVGYPGGAFDSAGYLTF
jgi:hypothetical protein